MRYMKSNGKMMDEYPHSFGKADFARLERILMKADQVVPMCDVLSNNDPKLIAVRHDVDHNIEHALNFARWEAARDFRSTYFVLHTAWYYQDRRKLYDCMWQIHELGHELGLHHNTVGMLSRADKLVPIDGSVLPAGWCDEAAILFADELKALRAEHFHIVGCAAHGAGIPEVSNMDLWAAGYTPRDFALEYEAYHLHHRAYYVTDNRGKWTGEHNRKEWPALREDIQLHISMHPCHWDFKEVL